MRTLVKVVMVAALLGAATGTAPAFAETAESKRERLGVAVGPMVIWSMATRCGQDVPEKLKLEAMLLIKGGFREEDVLGVVELLNATTDKLYFKLNDRERRKFCLDAMRQASAWED